MKSFIYYLATFLLLTIPADCLYAQTTKQHPLCALLYQQEILCLNYAKALGGTAAKAAQKPEDPAASKSTDKLNEFLEATQG